MDITIEGFGFYSIAGNSPDGYRWVNENCDYACNGVVYCDDTRMTRDIAEAAIAAGLAVSVNGHEYLGAVSAA